MLYFEICYTLKAAVWVIIHLDQQERRKHDEMVKIQHCWINSTILIHSLQKQHSRFHWMQSGWLILTSSFNFDLKASSEISQCPKRINHSVTVHFLNSLHSYHLEKRVCPKQVLQRISFTKFSFLTPKLLWGLFIHMYSSRFVRYNNFKLIFEATIGMFKMNSKIDSIFWKSSLPKSPKKPYQTIFLLQRIDLWWAIEKTSFWV